MTINFYCQKFSTQIIYEMTFIIGWNMNWNDMCFNLNIYREYIWMTIASIFKKNKLSIDSFFFNSSFFRQFFSYNIGMWKLFSAL